jgi:AcrR family transcriptional regulator
MRAPRRQIGQFTKDLRITWTKGSLYSGKAAYTRPSVVLEEIPGEAVLRLVGAARGRPVEDRLQRQREIYEAAGPLILAYGPRRLSMQQIARATHASVGSLYYYFPTKRDLVLCGLQPDILAHRCAAFHRSADHLRRTDPRLYLNAFVESSVEGILFLRPAVYAATELGSSVLWPSLEAALAANTQEFQEALRGALSTSDARVPGLARFGRTWRRFFFGAVLDWDAPRQELADSLRALLRGLTPSEFVLRPARTVTDLA